MRHGDEGVQAMEAAYALLTGSQALADALGVTLVDLPGRVWPEVAPTGTPSPWVVYSTADTVDVAAIGPLPRLFTRVPLLVKGVAQAETYGPLAPVARAIYETLHGAEHQAVSDGGTVLTFTRTGGVQFPEQENGIQYRHLGHTLQVSVQ